MTLSWSVQLEASLRTQTARRERMLFRELNPELNHTPILSEPPSNPRPASVLIGVRNQSDPTVVFTVRTPTMPTHAGQISFPGGGPKEEDQDQVATALREMEEEVSIPADAAQVLGTLGPHHGGLGYVVTPVVALIDPQAEVVGCPREVAEAFEVPLRTLVDPSNHVVERRTFNETPYKMYALPVFDIEGERRHIWGLTAGILRTLSIAFGDVSEPVTERTDQEHSQNGFEAAPPFSGSSV